MRPYTTRCRVFELSRLKVAFVEPGMRRIEFRDRGVDVFDVERDFQCDPTVLVEADHLEHLILRRPGTRIYSANFQSKEGKTLTTRRDGRVTVSHHA